MGQAFQPDILCRMDRRQARKPDLQVHLVFAIEPIEWASLYLMGLSGGETTCPDHSSH